VLHCNEAAAAIAGHEDDSSLIGSTLFELFPVCPREEIEAAFEDGLIHECMHTEFTIKPIEPGAGNEGRYCVVLHRKRVIAALSRAPIPVTRSSVPIEPLSKREAEVVRLLIEDVPLKEIAGRLFVSENTVKTHVRHIYRKTGTNTRQELVDWLERLSSK
jgi:DNA-binding CsgD family transcriptional regulator